jgi:ribosomal protein S12 methylthiotransferase accessory factor YcaO
MNREQTPKPDDEWTAKFKQLAEQLTPQDQAVLLEIAQARLAGALTGEDLADLAELARQGIDDHTVAQWFAKLSTRESFKVLSDEERQERLKTLGAFADKLRTFGTGTSGHL